MARRRKVFDRAGIIAWRSGSRQGARRAMVYWQVAMNLLPEWERSWYLAGDAVDR